MCIYLKIFYDNLEFKMSGIKNQFSIQLTKHEIEHPKEPKSGLENKVKEIVISKEYKIKYIILQVKTDKKDLNKDIKLLNQVETYKNYYNFERDDIETIIDNQMVYIKFKDNKYYWNFTTTGIHTIKIIFKKYYCNAINYFMNVEIYIKQIVQILIVLKSLIVQKCFLLIHLFQHHLH